MVQINFALKEVNCKVVYYGPGLSGKTTNLEVVHQKAPTNNVGELTSIATEGDRTLFFDFLPLNLGMVAGMQTKFQIYTVPGQVYYNSTRKLVLQGADGVVFVADSRKGKIEENIESLRNLEDNLEEYGLDINTVPLVFQYNKRDLDDLYTVEELEKRLNRFDAPYFEAVAVSGEGVFPTLKKLSSMVLENLNRQHGSARIKVKQKSKTVPAKKTPELVTHGGGSGAADGETPASPPKKERPPAQPGTGEAKTRPSGKKGQRRVIRDKISNSPGVRPIERKAPPQTSTLRRNNKAAGASVGSAAKKYSKTGLIVGVVIALLAAGGAVIYFSGIWKTFLSGQ
jgi:signal recognition particle receptor subunit beta